MGTLPDSGQNGIPLALVLVAKLLTVPPLLLPSPNAHLTHRNDDEDDCAETPVDKCHTYPRDRLKHVVGACHKTETQTLRDTSVGAAWTAKVFESQMGAVVADLANHKQSHADVCE